MATYARKVGDLWKLGWHTHPELMASTGLALIGVVMGVHTVRRYYANDGDNKKYKLNFVIMRPDDPKAAKVHKD